MIAANDTRDAVAYLREHTKMEPDLALVLGSGLGALADAVEEAVVVSAAEIPGFPAGTVQGHRGRLVFGRLEGRPVVVLQGRVHAYEGYPLRAVTFPIRLVHALGARRLVVTNAAGGINPHFRPGTLMFITDHINWAFGSPLAGPNVDGGARFVDLSDPYDRAWLDRAEGAALQHGIATRRGVYLWTSGPSYETRAEIQMFARLGADAVGMSTVPEVIQAAYLGMRTLGISTITNPAAGLSSEALSHDEVLTVGARVRDELERLVRIVVAET